MSSNLALKPNTTRANVVKLDMGELRTLIQQFPTVAVELGRLLIAHNVLISLHHMYTALVESANTNPKPQEFTEGDRTVHYFLVIGVLKEGLDAFRVLHSNEWLSRQKALIQDSEFQQLRFVLAIAADKSKAASFYNEYLKPTRDDAGFHWDRDRVKILLEDLINRFAEPEYPKLFVGYSQRAMDFRSPLGDQLLINLAAWDTSSPTSIFEYTEKASKVEKSLRHFTARLVQHLVSKE